MPFVLFHLIIIHRCCLNRYAGEAIRQRHPSLFYAYIQITEQTNIRLVKRLIPYERCREYFMEKEQSSDGMSQRPI